MIKLAIILSDIIKERLLDVNFNMVTNLLFVQYVQQLLINSVYNAAFYIVYQ